MESRQESVNKLMVSGRKSVMRVNEKTPLSVKSQKGLVFHELQSF